MSTSASTTSPTGNDALAGTLLAVSFIAVVLRFVARKVQRAPLEADDWLVIPAWLMFLAMCGCVFDGVGLRLIGYSTKVVSSTGAPPEISSKLYIALDIFTAACYGLTKLSALLFYIRIFCVSGRAGTFKILCYSSIVIVTLWTIVFIILPPLQCGTHFSALWIAKDKAKYCTHSHPYILSNSITDLLLEVLVLALPIPKIWTLRTTVRRRLAVTFVFLAALVSLGASIARLAIFVELLGGEVKDTSLGNTTIIFMWVLEAGFALIAVNLPSLYYLRRRVSPEKVLQSVRSALSLQSLGSRGSKSSKASKTSKRSGNKTMGGDGIISTEKASLGDGRSDRSAVGLVPPTHGTSESHAMYSINSRDEEDVPPMPQDRIKVTNRVSQSIE